ncbi:P-loop containing nucleoside triphosphate hydrolase protein [Coniophora puteana RWD-64-598 SS2]|uniref:ATP-dependent DNA helicase n=1 Tax=Coniophora puteana (strain RWD-64-598) TaxID=741705 RepID=A0A5M3N5C4_CONPW|nr:P-loop containing nucleoside triphosphate hydrolase protein [Coniophora puteana RWD-64-598 SS2]EIW86508.1 P-loop containing nucleoside triphosphate hydrolase protein [Coniophora puteana RWD-64-598 SS2]
MSSSDYYDDDPFDSVVLNGLDEIEAAYSTSQPPNPPAQQPKPAPPKHTESDDMFDDFSFDIPDDELRKLDAMSNAADQRKPQSVAGPSRPSNTVQRTLHGDVLQPTTHSKKASTSKPKSAHTLKPSSRNNSFGQQAPQTKQWDHTEFAKSGWKKPKSAKGKGKALKDVDEDADEAEENVEFEQFPAPFVPVGCPPPMKLHVDMLEAKHWIYPLNKPRRDYQYNIVRHCLFDNTLVALPTGLGKTFIAGVVMLNYYRWFPEGKVVFVAPTKPLVAQQIDACHKTCGIPGSDAVELTGNNPRPYRSQMWETKRVFYMTPQTLLNDLISDNCDPGSIVLLVVDEAHKGTGDYAYAQVVRYLMAKNPHFRVLALTATPGSNPEAVQAIVDSLHISRIEIRNEASLDLIEYMHKKEIKQHIVHMSEDIERAKSLLKRVMENVGKPLINASILPPLDMVKLHPYRCTALVQQIGAQRNSQKWAMGALSRLSNLARCMGYLLESSASMCYHSLQEFASGNSASKKIAEGDDFKALARELQTQLDHGSSLHPKMELLKDLLVQHFGTRMGEDEDGGEDTRAMVFITFRDCVDEVVNVLNQENPLIRATRFIGQGTDKSGRKGFAQKEQLQTIQKFKDGTFNVLVSTSIGEEGLDIGEVDMIVCYDAQKTPIRMLQRVGRTGRKRAGYVHVLLAETREEANWDKAQETYEDLQKAIVRGDQVELYGDVPRLLPDHAKPQPLEKVMEIEAYSRDVPLLRKKSSAVGGDDPSGKGKKRKRNDDIARNIPAGAATGFVSVAELLVKKPKKKKKRVFNEDAGEDDSTDMELESGILDIRRTVSTPAETSSSKKTKSAKLRKSATTVTSKPEKASTARKKAAKKKQLPQVIDDEDDLNLGQDTLLAKRRPDTSASSTTRANARTQRSLSLSSTERSPQQQSVLPPYDEELSGISQRRLSPLTAQKHDVIELTSSPVPSRSASPSWKNIDQSKASTSSNTSDKNSVQRPLAQDSDLVSPPKSMAWLIESDEDPDIHIVDSSPMAPKHSSQKASVPPYQTPSKRNIIERPTSTRARMFDDSVIIVEPGSSSPLVGLSALDNTSSPEHAFPEATFAVRPLGQPRLKRRPAMVDSSPSMPPPPQKRLQRRNSEDPDSPAPVQAPPPPRMKRQRIRMKYNAWLNGEAAHSGDEVSEGASCSDDDQESESDRRFLQEPPETQVSPSYDQTVAYRQGLMTQAPLGGPLFANRPVRGGPYLHNETMRRRPLVSSSPVRTDGEPDEYEYGSFIVQDDAEIIYEGPSSDAG